jgi:hypothetical protein
VTPREAFRFQAAACARMGSPFTARLCTLLADRLAPGGDVADRVLDWPGDPRSDNLPLRLAGGLHGLVLEGRSPALATAYPPHDPADPALWAAVEAALAAEAPYLLQRLQGPPQTNEAQRAAALCPGFLTVAALTGLPLAASELGASAGLNLCWDSFSYRFGAAAWGDPALALLIAPDWQGAPPPLPPARVAERAGCDVAPLDMASAEDRTRLLSYIWADQAARIARMTAAIEIARANRVRVETADAADWLALRLSAPRPGRAHVVYHSAFWLYLPAATQDRIRASLDAAGARASRAAPLAWLRVEDDGDAPDAAIALTLWPDGETRILGRADFHGSSVRWDGWR